MRNFWSKMFPSNPKCYQVVLAGLRDVYSIALHWTSINWTELHWTELHWTALSWTALNYTAVHCPLHCLQCSNIHYQHKNMLHCIALIWTELHCSASHHTIKHFGMNCTTMPLALADIFFGDSKSRRASKSHYWFKTYGVFAEWVDFAYWWSFSEEGTVSAACAAGLF